MPITLLAVAAVAGFSAGGLPYFDVPNFEIPGIHITIQVFGMLVATGVIVGAEMCRRYSLRFGVDDDDLRKLTGWVVVVGFIGAHLFDVLAYQREEVSRDPILILQLWKGISSYGGFIGAATGFSIFVWMKRLRTGLMADIILVGTVPGFAIGRIGCSIVHDHIGRTTDFFLGFDYPWRAIVDRHLDAEFTKAAVVHAHNLGFYELLYLIPVNVIVLSLAFGKKRLPAGFLAVLAGLLYAPVRFFFEYLRLSSSDPRYLGLTFAQWASLIAFGIAAYAMVRLIKTGKPAPLASELDGGIVGGYRDGVAAPRRKKADDDKDPGATKPATKRAVQAKKKK
jgi:phosphatidylglycerol---prolipoprotein diacylglyceryl transferase